MAKKLNKKQRKAFARMVAYQLLDAYDSTAMSDTELSEDEKAILIEELKLLAIGLSKNLPYHIASTEGIYKYCKNELSC